MNFFQIGEFLRFFRKAVTKYQLHSPFVFELACALVEDKRWFYAFRDVEEVRQKMLASDVALHVTATGQSIESHNRLENKYQSLRSLARQRQISTGAGRLLFRLANHLQPRGILEIGTSLGIGTMYMASAAREASFLSLEMNSGIAGAARVNLELLGLNKNVKVIDGDIELSLPIALKDLEKPDVFFFNSSLSPESFLHYFERSLSFAHFKTVFVFNRIHATKGSVAAWTQIKAHPRVTLTLDFFELSLVYIDPDFREKQDIEILSARCKPWMFF